jgi:hypothetical protein
MAIGTIVEIVVLVAIVVNSMVDRKKREQFAEALQQMTDLQMQEVARKVDIANSQTAKIAVLSEYVTNFLIQQRRNAQYKNALLIAGAGAIVITAAIVFFKVIKPK